MFVLGPQKEISCEDSQSNLGDTIVWFVQEAKQKSALLRKWNAQNKRAKWK